MARQIQIIVPLKFTDELIESVKEEDGLLSMFLQKQASLKPPGDILTLQITNSSLPHYMRIFESFQLGKEGGIAISTSEPDSVITNKPDFKIENDSQDATWEEVAIVISKDSNMTLYLLILMMMAGIITTVGLATSTIHVVIGGMLIAPGFMPIMRITLGLIVKNKYWYRGLIDTVKGYLALMVGAVLATYILRISNINPLQPKQEYYQLYNTLIDYWSTISLPSVVSTTAASVVGVLLLITKRTIFTSGVMIALAIVPAATIMSISLISGEFGLAGKAFVRFAVDLVIMLFISFLLFSVYQNLVNKRSIKT